MRGVYRLQPTKTVREGLVGEGIDGALNDGGCRTKERNPTLFTPHPGLVVPWHYILGQSREESVQKKSYFWDAL